MADSKAQKYVDQSGMQIVAKWLEDVVASTGLSIALRTRSPKVTSALNTIVLRFGNGIVQHARSWTKQ
ncbi:hypothetical protein [Aneurinibacillus terranovensis]|uniref:hypothetical protein n=1 Tax=Aneurinibacillus terranovensis TaxID=278991 RepID=UPI0012DD2F5C